MHQGVQSSQAQLSPVTHACRCQRATGGCPQCCQLEATDAALGTACLQVPAVGDWVHCRMLRMTMVQGQLQGLFFARSKCSSCAPDRHLLEAAAQRQRDGLVAGEQPWLVPP